MGGNNIVSLVPYNIIIDHGVWFISSPIDMNDVRSQTDRGGDNLQNNNSSSTFIVDLGTTEQKQFHDTFLVLFP